MANEKNTAKKIMDKATSKIKESAKDLKERTNKVSEKLSDDKKNKNKKSNKNSASNAKNDVKEPEKLIMYQRVKVSSGAHQNDPMFKDRIGTVYEINESDDSYTVQFADDYGGIVMRNFPSSELKKI